MDLFKHTAKIREYCDYVDEHVRNVQRAWDELKVACAGMPFICDDHLYWSIDALVLEHDMSKVSPEEFIQYQRRFYPVGDADKEGFEGAWQHHKDHNPHHWENWAAREFYNPYEARVHCVCMVIDWMAMGYKFGDTAESYYRANADKIEIPEWAVEFVDAIFLCLATQAEAEVK